MSMKLLRASSLVAYGWGFGTGLMSGLGEV